MQIKFGIPSVASALLNAPGIWHFAKSLLDWRGRLDAARSIQADSSDVVSNVLSNLPPGAYAVALIVGILLIYWDSRRPTKEIMIDVSPLALALVATFLAVGAWGWFLYDRSRGPIIWTWSDNNPVSFSGSPDKEAVAWAFFVKGLNRSEDAIRPTRAFIRSNVDRTEIDLGFNRGVPVTKGAISAGAEFTLVGVIPTTRKDWDGGITASEFRDKFSSFVFFFESPAWNYEVRFSKSDVSALLIAGEKKIRGVPPAPGVVIDK